LPATDYYAAKPKIEKRVSSYTNMGFGFFLGLGILAIGVSFIYLQVEGGGMTNMSSNVNFIVILVLGVLFSGCICILWILYECYWKHLNEDKEDETSLSYNESDV
jgi:hypothetical protein